MKIKLKNNKRTQLKEEDTKYNYERNKLIKNHSNEKFYLYNFLFV